MAAPPPQSFPYDYLFKVLIIGDASVGKVRFAYTFSISSAIFDCLMKHASNVSRTMPIFCERESPFRGEAGRNDVLSLSTPNSL